MKKSLSLTLSLLLFTAHTPVHAADWGTNNLPNETAVEKPTYLEAAKALLEQPIQEITVNTKSVQTLEEVQKEQKEILDEAAKQKLEIDKEPTAPVESKNPYDGILAPVPAKILWSSPQELMSFHTRMQDTAQEIQKVYGVRFDKFERREDLSYVHEVLGENALTSAQKEFIDYVAFLDAFFPKEGSQKPTSTVPVGLPNREAFTLKPQTTKAYTNQLILEDNLISTLSLWPTLKELVDFRYHTLKLLDYLKIALKDPARVGFKGVAVFSEESRQMWSGNVQGLAQNVTAFAKTLRSRGLQSDNQTKLDLETLDFLVHHLFLEENSLTVETEEKFVVEKELLTPKVKMIFTFIYHLLDKSPEDFLTFLHPELTGKYKEELLKHPAYKALRDREYFPLTEGDISWTLTKTQVDLGLLRKQADVLFTEQKKPIPSWFSRNNK